MSENKGKCGMQNLLNSVLSVANAEQNSSYPPWVFQAHVNTVTSLLINALVKSYPINPQVLDVLDPYVDFKMLPVSNGFFQLPEEYRNILGAPMIFANPSKNGECGGEVLGLTKHDFQVGQVKSGCNMVPISIIPESEFGLRTQSTYKFPTYEHPIGYMAGKKRVKVCPYDVTKVYLLYAVQEKKEVFGYIMQPDDTYIFDPNTSIDTIWGDSAFDIFFTALLALYSAYSRDKELSDWSQVLKQTGIL